MEDENIACVFWKRTPTEVILAVRGVGVTSPEPKILILLEPVSDKGLQLFPSLGRPPFSAALHQLFIISTDHALSSRAV